VVHFSGSPSLLGTAEFLVPTGSFFQLILTFGDFGILEQEFIRTIKSEIENLKDRELIAKQFAESNEKPTYFDILVRINVGSLTDYYKGVTVF
jgi:hypothetical protein